MPPRTTIFNGQYPGWTGHVQNVIPCTPSDTVDATPVDQLHGYMDPPARAILCTVAGNIVFTLNGDDESVGANKITRALTVGQELTIYAVRKVFATGTTATFQAMR